ncbi:MAG TPA: pantoate--beta-alanine ligase [Candidatus Polarisedimenticolia bacterium]|nr:pantoate--beta-alanine ligase [Candidatus Polarisedimenticolia bacterium]
MDIVTTAAGMKGWSRAARTRGGRLGLVPTMGALHDGHLSLVARARGECEQVALSIYVNPLQFGPQEDFARYQRDLKRDAELARGAGVDVVFAPDDGEIHLPGHRTWVEVSGMQDALCGRSRPGHFRGVATVVLKLLAIATPAAAYFGEKDAQQLRIIRRMARDLHLDCAIVGCPTVREKDGLAMSSRNAYLTPEERRAAPILHRALEEGAALVRAGEAGTARIVAHVRTTLASDPLARVDYVEAVDDETLETVTTVRGRVLLAAAAWFGRARLIDNVVLSAPEGLPT